MAKTGFYLTGVGFCGYHVAMSQPPIFDNDSLRAEIAAAAARMIAEEGASYGAAKRKAVRQVLGEGRAVPDVLPDNAQIEDEVRIYNELFLSDSQPARLAKLRRLALEVMEELAPFHPYLTGAVLNGTAGEYSELHLELFTDNPKDVEIFLLNLNVNFDVTEVSHFRPGQGTVEMLSFMRANEGVHLALYPPDDLRGAVRVKPGRRAERADLAAVRALVNPV